MIPKKIVPLVSIIFLLISACIPFNFMLGSRFSFFSCVSMSLPALSFHSSLVYVIFYFFTKACLTQLSLLNFLAARLPLFFSSLVMTIPGFFSMVAIPIIAFLTFVLHPVGRVVFYYGWLWFIPLIVYYKNMKSLFSRALSASCVAHAVGSVVWIYKMPCGPEFWRELMVIVVIERFLIACGIVAFIYIFRAIESIYFSRLQV